VMAGGRILQTGRPRDLYEHPTQLQVGRFLGRNNLIRVVRLSSSKDELGEFSLQPRQSEVRAIFLPLTRVQRDLNLGGRANTIGFRYRCCFTVQH